MSLKELCRTCLLSSKTMVSISGSKPKFELNKYTILDLLKTFTEISLSSNDGFPDNICSNCLNKIRVSYRFKLKCEKSESILKLLRENGKSVNDLITPEKIEDSETLSDDQLEQPGSPEILKNGIINEQVSIIQEIKQEPEIEINMEEGDFNMIDSDKERFKKEGDFNMIDSDKERFKNDLQCSVCTKIFKSKSNLKIHTRVHTAEKPFQCELCPKKFRYRNNLKSHNQNAHSTTPTNTGKFKCALCSTFCRNKSAFTRHMIVHAEERPFHCKMCPKNFRAEKSLTEHMKTLHSDGETNNKKFECPTCAKLFRRKDHLNEHIRIHTGEMPFQCEVCDQKYRYKTNLKRHMETGHSDGSTINRKFKCGICSKEFKSQCSLNEHMRIHTGEKPFQCEICLRKFRYRQNYKIHIESAHND